MPEELDALAGQLTGRLAGLGSAVIGFSGGVDSSVVAALAARALGERAVAVISVSPALASGELDGARSVARAAGVRHELVSTAGRGVRHPLLGGSVGKGEGYRELRVRHFGDLGGVRPGAADLPRAADPDEHAAVLACVRVAGYQRAGIGGRPLRSGSLNLGITPVSRAG